CGVCHWCQLFPVTRFSYHEYKWIGAFSILYTLNIALSNASLHLVSVPFHQVARATTPLFTILLSYFFFRKHYSKSILFTQVPIVVGVGLATKGEFNITTYGLVLTFLGTIFAALKGITTNIVLVGQLQLHPLDLLYKMSPLALFQIFMYIAISGEYQRLMVLPLDLQLLLHLTFNGSMAFFLNYVSFTTNKKAGPLTMNVAGIATTLFGGAMYSFLEAQEKMKAIVYSKVDKYTNEL
ncbi:UAA transporter, partial [Coelomomyces lativittatus]